MVGFHPLEVTDIRKTTRDAVVLTLQPVAGGDFSFLQGQYLTFRRVFDGTEVRRSYSICAAKGDRSLQVGIKRVDGGAFSTWANEEISPGLVIEAMEPMGNFHAPLRPEARSSYLGFAGGSGITPVLSILRTVLAEEPLSRFTLVYANRGPQTIMFREELEELKNQFMGRLTVIHVLEAGADDVPLFQGRVDGEKCAALFGSLIDVAAVDRAFICGPEPMMLGIAAALRAHGLTDAQIKYELFASDQPGRLRRHSVAGSELAQSEQTRATIVLDGASYAVDVAPEASLLDAALASDIQVPYACKAGVCSTCKCKVLSGEVEMVANHALEDYEVAQGFVLSCQSYPVTEHVKIDYDHH